MTHQHTHAKKKSKSIIPGFGLSFGIVMAILGIIVVIPLCSLVVFSARLSLSEFWQTITRPRVLSSYAVSLSTAFIASLINAVMGLILAWVLVRYKFPGKRIMDGIIELPFALPTAVAGIALTHLTERLGRKDICQIRYRYRVYTDRYNHSFGVHWNTIRREKCPAGSRKG